MIQSRTLFIAFLLLSFSSCISKKKHLAAIDLANLEHQSTVTKLQEKIDISNKNIRNLELDVAERIGENNILLILRDELQGEIVTLEASIENLSSTSSSAQKNLSTELATKDQTIKQLKGYLAEVESTITQYESVIKTVTGDLNYIAQDYPEDIDVSLGFDFATIEILESFLFKKNSTTRLQDSGLSILEKFAEIFQKFPNINVQVIGHTDTAPPKDRKRYNDNWNFSALQTATIVRILIDEYDVSANQVTLAAKADSSPRGSNSSSEGRLRNRRIEFRILMESEGLAKKVRTVLSKNQ